MLYEKSELYNDETLDHAVQKVSRFTARMGGTEIYAPLKAIFEQPLDENLHRHIYLLTDGAVSDTEAVVELIKSNSNKTCVHTFGIGSGVSTELIKECAVAGRGHYSFI